MRDTLRCFEIFRKKKITFGDINFNFYESLSNYLLCEHIHRRRKETIKGFKVSTAGKIIKQLRIFIRNRVKKNIIPTINLEDFKVLDEQSDAIYLTYGEIESITFLDLSKKPFLEKYRDLLVLGCLTGLRFSDFSKIQASDIRDSMLYKKQKKSNHWVVIPLRSGAEKILKDNFKKQVPSVHDVDFNRYIKIIGQLAGINTPVSFSYKRANKKIEVRKPKHDWITSHTCRRSFCTNEFLAGTPVELIMKISGHKSLTDFYRYIKISPEEAAEKIKRIWLERGEIKAP
jgi:integrase